MPKKRGYKLLLDTENIFLYPNQLPYNIGILLLNGKNEIVQSYNIGIKNGFYKYKKQYQQLCPHKYKYIKTNSKIYTWLTFIDFDILIKDLINQYNITTVIGYNLPYDLTSLKNGYLCFLNNLQKYPFKGNCYKFIDLWDLCVDKIGTLKKYNRFCVKNGFLTKKGYINTSCEVMYQFFKNDISFQQSHTALADCFIELDLFINCLSKHTKNHKHINKLILPLPKKGD